MSCKSPSLLTLLSVYRLKTVPDEYSFSSPATFFVTLSCRYGAAEPHTVSAFLGGKSAEVCCYCAAYHKSKLFINSCQCVCLGSAAQEAIKIISHQFVPFSNTFIYNAMSQTSATFHLWTQLLIKKFPREISEEIGRDWKMHLLIQLALINPNCKLHARLKERGRKKVSIVLWFEGEYFVNMCT